MHSEPVAYPQTGLERRGGEKGEGGESMFKPLQILKLDTFKTRSRFTN